MQKMRKELTDSQRSSMQAISLVRKAAVFLDQVQSTKVLHGQKSLAGECNDLVGKCQTYLLELEQAPGPPASAGP